MYRNGNLEHCGEKDSEASSELAEKEKSGVRKRATEFAQNV